MRLHLRWMLATSALALVLAVSCRTRDSGSEIRVTNPIVAGDMYPEVVAIEMLDSRGYISTCGGTFITANIILTAAQCLVNDAGERRTIFRYMAPDGRYHIAKGFISPSYKRSLEMSERMKYDIAILRFDEPIAPKVAIISKTLPKRDTEVTAVGFGDTDTMKKSGTGAKHYGNNSVMMVVGSTSYLIGSSPTKSPGVWPGAQSHIGHGDSGGGIFNKKGELIGVSSISGFVNERNKDGISDLVSGFVNIRHPAIAEQLKEIAVRVCGE